MKKKSSKKADSSKTPSKSKSKSKDKSKKKTSKKILSAAAQFKRTSKKIIDDMFLKLVGSKVLARAQEVASTIKKEKKVKGRK